MKLYDAPPRQLQMEMPCKPQPRGRTTADIGIGRARKIRTTAPIGQPAFGRPYLYIGPAVRRHSEFVVAGLPRGTPPELSRAGPVQDRQNQTGVDGNQETTNQPIFTFHAVSQSRVQIKTHSCGHYIDRATATAVIA